MICSICGKTLTENESKFPNNAWPIKEREDPCCDYCYVEFVGYYNAIIRPMPRSLQNRLIKNIRAMSIEDLKSKAKIAIKDNANL